MTRFLICPGEGPAAKPEGTTLPKSRAAVSRRPAILRLERMKGCCGTGVSQSFYVQRSFSQYIYTRCGIQSSMVA